MKLYLYGWFNGTRSFCREVLKWWREGGQGKTSCRPSARSTPHGFVFSLNFVFFLDAERTWPLKWKSIKHWGLYEIILYIFIPSIWIILTVCVTLERRTIFVFKSKFFFFVIYHLFLNFIYNFYLSILFSTLSQHRLEKQILVG